MKIKLVNSKLLSIMKKRNYSINKIYIPASSPQFVITLLSPLLCSSTEKVVEKDPNKTV